MLRDNLVGLIEPMSTSAGVDSLALRITRQQSSDDRPLCLENPRPEGAESTLAESARSPFQAEPRHNALSFTHKKEFIVWYSEAKKEDTRARRVEKMKRMLVAGKVIS